jgi:hypothetical protein
MPHKPSKMDFKIRKCFLCIFFSSKAYAFKNLQMLPENFKGQERTDQRQEIEICCWGRKQNYIFAPSCSAVQLGRKYKPLPDVARAFVEHQHLFSNGCKCPPTTGCSFGT